MKTIEESFIDWESSAIGYGYGSGEPFVIPALRKLLSLCPNSKGYDYRVLEDAVGGSTCWLLISALCKSNILEYGTSPRFAWLTKEGEKLKEFMLSKTDNELIDLVCGTTENYITCYPDACNCGPMGYQEGIKCQNPFWPRGTP